MFCRSMIDELQDWDHIDFINVKSKESAVSTTVYYWEGHPVFEQALTETDLDFIHFVRAAGCYGASEKACDDPVGNDRFYIKVNIQSVSQEQAVIGYLLRRNKLTNERKQLLDFLCGINTVVDHTDDYMPLYYCGFTKSVDSHDYNTVRLYFKTFGADESVRYDVKCIDYLSRCSRIQNDSAFSVVKNLVLNHKVGLRCIGIEFFGSEQIKIKYYLCEIDGGSSVYEILCGLKNFLPYNCSAEALLLKWDEFAGLKQYMLQISSGYNGEECSVSLYMHNSKKQKKKYYALKVGLVLRNIGGVSFLVDIHEKHYYDLKELFSVNETGKAIIEYLFANEVCTLDGIVSYLKSIILNYTEELYPVIYTDCEIFLKSLKTNGYLQEVG